MKDLIRILTIISLNQIFSHLGRKHLPLVIFLLGYCGEVLVIPWRRKKHRARNLHQAVMQTLQQLGPIYIKFGQTLSTRPDIIGVELAESLRQLQDKLPAFPFSQVKHIIEVELGAPIESIFSEFMEKPVAAASVAQVHKARLHNGTLVAVKVLRPNTKEAYNRDLQLLYSLAKAANICLAEVKRLRLVAVIDVFKKNMQHELDFMMEAAAASEMQANFVDDSSLYIPEVFWAFTTSKILTSAWVEGISIYDTEAIAKAGIDRTAISAKIAIIFFNQAYRDGFFHADLHPGNILVKANGQVVLLDFGIVGRLPERDRLAVAEILDSFLRKDYLRLAKIHINAGYVPPDTSPVLFASACRAIGEPIVGLPLAEISISRLLGQLFKVTRDFGMETQPQLLLLQKTTVVVEGIGRGLNPDLNMWQLAEPWIKKWAIRNISPEAKLLRVAKTMLEQFIAKLD